MKPSRLHRWLAASIGQAGPYFEVTSAPTGAMNDDVIKSISVTRGNGERGGGYTPNLLEVSVTGMNTVDIVGSTVQARLTSSAAEAIATRCGNVTAAQIQKRFYGRFATTAVDDQGKEFTTTYTASSWLTQMLYATRKALPLGGARVSTYLADLFNIDNPARGVVMNFYGSFPYVALTEDESLTVRNGLSKYGDEIGLLFRETRDGTTNVMTLPYRTAQALAAIDASIPLTRSQALRPASWSQNNERASLTLDVTATANDGHVAVYTVADPDDPGWKESGEVDWAHIRIEDEGWFESHSYREARAQVFTTSTRWYQIPTVTVDLLYLLRSESTYHQQQAGKLLALEVGEPLFFSGDWPTVLRGVHFVEGIKESITSAGWELELSLVPWAPSTGSKTLPSVPAKVWDSAQYPWDQETRTWNEAGN
ncbi:hypothetical protein [Glutamicibacter halophytocola]|uniref:hypothetical protein n=1 Tax=Glutamicibacter halophytocola TaxID=1933880 RepID=UPI0015C541DD|nr:hypothetical protein [Glutamicibacter halophytocola]NQD40912.1 hypothetical protein [Glutamicibacter halophytocola]